MKQKKESNFLVMKVKDLKNFAPNLKIDWLKLINDQLLNSQEVSDHDEAGIYSPSTMTSWSLALDTIDKE